MSHRRVLSFLAGLATALALFGPARVPADAGAGPGAELRLAVTRTGELDLAPVGDWPTASELRPGDDHLARLAVTNRTGHAVRVRLDARAVSRELDGPLVIRVSVRGRTVYDGTLAGLRGGTRPFALGAGRSAPVVVRAGLAPVTRGYEGRSVDVTLEPRS